MPRLYNGDSDPLDFCNRHFPKNEALAFARYGAGEGPDGRGNCFGYDCEHPPYSDDSEGPDAYRCQVCRCVLTDGNA